MAQVTRIAVQPNETKQLKAALVKATGFAASSIRCKKVRGEAIVVSFDVLDGLVRDRNTDLLRRYQAAIAHFLVLQGYDWSASQTAISALASDRAWACFNAGYSISVARMEWEL